MHRTYQSIIEIQKPAIAKVNGNAIGFGSSLAFACDLIVAAEDAVFCDHHLAMGKSCRVGAPISAPCPATAEPVRPAAHAAVYGEGVSLAREGNDAKELVAKGIINAAVPARRA